MSKERFEYFVDEWDEYNWYVKDNKNNEEFEYLEDVTKILNQQSQRIAELEERVKNAIVPKFNRQEHIYSIIFGEIREFIVVAYLDNNTTLCEDTTTSHLEWCDNQFLVRTFEEAEAKLQELRG